MKEVDLNHMKEVDLNKKVSKAINTLPDCYAEKRWATPGNRGKPDVTGSVKGIRLELEGKLPGNKPTPKQNQWLRHWERLGAITGVYHSVEEAMEIIFTRFPALRRYWRN